MYKLLFIIIALFVIMFSVTKCNEGFANTTSAEMAIPITSDNVADYIYKIYKADVKAIQNLADIAQKLQAGGVTVPGKMIIQNGLDVTNDTKLNGKLDVTNDTKLNGKLDVIGETTLSRTLGVTGATTLNSTLEVIGATKLNGKLEVMSATTLSSTLGVTGATTLSTLQVGQLNVTNTTTLTSLQVNNGLQVKNGSMIDGLTKLSTLQVNGGATIDGTTIKSLIDRIIVLETECIKYNDIIKLKNGYGNFSMYLNACGSNNNGCGGYPVLVGGYNNENRERTAEFQIKKSATQTI